MSKILRRINLDEIIKDKKHADYILVLENNKCVMVEETSTIRIEDISQLVETVKSRNQFKSKF